MLKIHEHREIFKNISCNRWSEMSMKAAEYDITMAKKDNAKLVVVSVIYTPASTFTYAKQERFDEFLKKSKDESAKWFDKIKKMPLKMEYK